MAGVGVEGVASQIGALAVKETFTVRRSELIPSLCHRFNVSKIDAERAIQRALEVGVVREDNGIIELVMDEG